ncbi:MAG: hypothetical protein IJJ21_01990 [Firmicutes bacterium]|nr:hypothetical protein [Bacillota bacterium]
MTDVNKKELPYFHIDGGYGGNQSWFLDPWMHIGGCGALTMCDLLLYQCICRGRTECYPFDASHLTKRDYRKFGMQMKPYLRPRESGIKDLKTFMDGAMIYLEDSEIEGFSMGRLDGSRPCEEAEAAVVDRIDHDMPVPMLMLKHRDKKFSFFEWHWFLIVGYERRQNGFYVKIATYGKEHWLNFNEFWDTGELERGGLVLVSDQA